MLASFVLVASAALELIIGEAAKVLRTSVAMGPSRG